jgi:hypothetical protein
VTHPFRKDVNRFTKNGKKELRDDLGGHGPQIARELVVCAVCANK